MNGSIRQRSKGSWQICYEGPADTAGMRKYLSETIKGTKKEADRVLKERLAAIESGGYVPEQKDTVAQFLQRWLGDYAVPNTRPRTKESIMAATRRARGSIIQRGPDPQKCAICV